MISPSMLRRSALQGLVMPLLVGASIVMIVLGKVDQVMFESARTALADRVAPVLDALSRPVLVFTELAARVEGLVDLYQENRRLADENRKLMQWQETALALADENRALRDLTRLVPQSALSFVSARVIATSGGAYWRNLMIDAGVENGVARGQAAITGDGLIGRVYDVGARASRILLITDLNSRVPVLVERSHQRAILAGDNSPAPLLWYLDPAAPLKQGDRIVTSGEGGIFPPGLPVGVVTAEASATPRVLPYARLSQVEYVRVVDYGLADGLPAPLAATKLVQRGAPGAGKPGHR